MKLPEHITDLSRKELQALVVELQRQLAQAVATIEELRAEVAQLKRSTKRQAAPFSKGSRVTKPKPPGRQPGRGAFSYRQVPSPEEITEPPVNVPVTLESCPDCGGKLEEERVDFAYITDVPPMPRPKVTQYRVRVCRCLRCGQRIRGQHPDLGPDQYGATAHRVGDRAMAAAHTLHYGAGIPVRKVPGVLEVLTGVKLTQGAVTQDALGRALGPVGRVYERLRASVQDRPVVHTDDTGWRVGGESAFLMAFATDEATVYQIRPRHRNQEVREVVPSHYPGVLVTDRGRSYDAQALDQIKQQKCLAHILRSISEVVTTKKGRGRSFGNQLKRLLREALALWHDYHAGEVVAFAAEASRLKTTVTHHLRDRVLPDRDNQRLLDEMGWHHDRGNLLRFLEDPGIEPTNNRAERALRPAVIARKVSQCSKNEAGAYAFSAFTSVIRTLQKVETQSAVEALYHLFQSQEGQIVPA